MKNKKLNENIKDILTNDFVIVFSLSTNEPVLTGGSLALKEIMESKVYSNYVIVDIEDTDEDTTVVYVEEEQSLT